MKQVDDQRTALADQLDFVAGWSTPGGNYDGEGGRTVVCPDGELPRLRRVRTPLQRGKSIRLEPSENCEMVRQNVGGKRRRIDSAIGAGACRAAQSATMPQRSDRVHICESLHHAFLIQILV